MESLRFFMCLRDMDMEREGGGNAHTEGGGGKNCRDNNLLHSHVSLSTTSRDDHGVQRKGGGSEIELIDITDRIVRWVWGGDRVPCTVWGCFGHWHTYK